MLSPLPKTFVAIIEAGSITGAAEELNLAKSAVSQNLKRLEEELGVKLAIRTTRRLTPTPAGVRYYERCKDLLTRAQQARTEMDIYGAVPSGPLTITAPHALISSLIAPALAHVTALYPKLEPRVIAEDKRLDLIIEGIDVAISVGKLPDSSLRARRIGALHDKLYVAPHWLSQGPDREDPTFLQWVQSIPYIAHIREQIPIKHLLGRGPNTELIDFTFHPAFRSNTIEAIAAFARKGLGIALLPDIGIEDDLKTGQLVPICPSLTPEPTPIYAMHAYDTLPPKSVEAIIGAIKDRLKTTK